MHGLLSIIAALTLAVGGNGTTQLNPPGLRNHDRVVFYGDSITDNATYCRDVEDYIVTHYPNLDVRFFNAGMSGDRVTGGGLGPIDERLTRDLFSRKPTVITIMLGMNDGGYRAFSDDLFATYQAGYRHIADRIHREAPNARVWIMLPSPYDNVTRPDQRQVAGYNEVLLRYADWLRGFAKDQGFGIVDENGPMVSMLTDMNRSAPDTAAQLIRDRIHPGWQADYLMAREILDAWGESVPEAQVQIDASSAGQWTGATVTDLVRSPFLAWTETDQSLPYFIPQGDALMEAVRPYVMPASQADTLRVTGLTDGTFHLRIDGKDVGAFTKEQLATGVNLDELDTPMFEQAAALRRLIDKRNDVWYQRWRQLDYNLADHPSSRLANAKRAMEGLDDELVSEERELAKPKPHRFEIAPDRG